jgi:hypothetical protein
MNDLCILGAAVPLRSFPFTTKTFAFAELGI